MHLSHSGLQQLLTCPASYFLSKKQGISLKQESRALSIGSAFHWGCEHNTDDLSDYLKELDLYQVNEYDFNKDVIMASGMVHGYLKHRDELLEQILLDYDGVTKLTVLDELHEFDVLVPLKSFIYPEGHEFHGIIDLLFLTEKGWIVLDYKTSSQKPDFEKYLDQVLRYCWMLKVKFPEIPVYKVGIINVKKTSIRQKANENEDNFLMRIQREYDINDSGLIEYYQFEQEDFAEERLNKYINNLSRTCDFAETIERTNAWYINYGNAVSVYGKSEFWNLFYKTPDCHLLYKVKDEMYNDAFGEVTQYRDCREIDIATLDCAIAGQSVMNHYKDFVTVVDCFVNSGCTMEQTDDCEQMLIAIIKEEYVTDDYLLECYWNEYWRRLNDESAMA